MTKKYYLQGGLYLLITVIYIVVVIWLGIPLAIKVAELVQRDKSVITDITAVILPPRLNYVPSATNSAELTVSGFSNANQKVELYLNDTREAEVETDAEGYFDNQITLTLGSNMIFAQAVDAKGQKSQSSNPLNINFLDIAPELTITEPINEQQIREKDNYILVKGNTEAGLTLRVNGKLGVIGADGNFSYRLGLSEGENTIVVEVMDPAGNKKEQKVVVSYRKR